METVAVMLIHLLLQSADNGQYFSIAFKDVKRFTAPVTWLTLQAFCCTLMRVYSSRPG